MPVTPEDLEELVREGVIDAGTARRIAEHVGLEGVDPDPGGSQAGGTGTRLAYYLGAGLVMAATGWFLNEAWLRYGGWALGGGALGYGIAFLGASESLRGRPGFRLPADLLVTLAVWTVPLVVFGGQDALGLWPAGDYPGPFSSYGLVIESNWLTMEAGLVLASAAALRYRPTPYLHIPLVVGLWFVCTDLVALGVGWPPGLVPEEAVRAATLLFGGAVLGAAFLLDRRTERDHSFWLYLLGTFAAWSALTGGGVGRPVYPAANLGLLVAGVLVRRRTPLVFGALGVFVHLSHLASDVFADSLLFPVAVTAVGIALMGAGLLYRENRERVEGTLRAWVPAALRRALPPNR